MPSRGWKRHGPGSCRYGVDRPTTCVYASGIALAGPAQAAIWWRAHGCRLLDSWVTSPLQQYFTIRVLIVPDVFLLSIPIAIVSEQVAYLTWLVAIPALIFLRFRFPYGEAGGTLEFG
jgi:hypothetical protein